MYNKKSLGTIYVFTALSCGVLILAMNTHRASEKSFAKAEKPDEVSSFKSVHFFRNLNSKPSLELKSTNLEIINQDILTFKKPEGQLFRSGKSLTYSADSGQFTQAQNSLELKGNIELKNALSSYLCDELTYDGRNETLFARGSVESTHRDLKTQDTIKLNSQFMRSNLKENLTQLNGNVKGVIVRRRKYEGDVKFQADKVELNSSKSLISLNQDVKIQRNNYYLQAQRAKIFLENFNKKLKYYELYDDVKLEEQVKLSSGEKQTRRAYAEKLEAHQSSGKIILTGAPRVEQGRDVIRGYQIILRENVELVEVDDSQSRFSIKRKK